MTDKPPDTLRTVTDNPVSAAFADAFGVPGHTWKAYCPYGSDDSSGPGELVEGLAPAVVGCGDGVLAAPAVAPPASEPGVVDP
jgi:hypothetical protein